jgi:hypothetical protein
MVRWTLSTKGISIFGIGKKEATGSGDAIEFYCDGGYLHTDEDEFNRVINNTEEILQMKPKSAGDFILRERLWCLAPI